MYTQMLDFKTHQHTIGTYRATPAEIECREIDERLYSVFLTIQKIAGRAACHHHYPPRGCPAAAAAAAAWAGIEFKAFFCDPPDPTIGHLKTFQGQLRMIFLLEQQVFL